MTTNPNRNRVRGRKVTLEQMSELVDLLLLPINKIVLTMKPHPLKAGEIVKLWEAIAKALNVLSGPKKTGEDWRRFFVEWKSRTRKKARDFNVEARATGGGPNPAKHLTEVEEKLMGLLGWVSVHGCQDMPEEQEIQEEYGEEVENFEDQHVLPFTESGDLPQTNVKYNLDNTPDESNQVEEELEVPDEVEVIRVEVEVPEPINIPSKRKRKLNVNPKRKPTSEKRRYHSSVSVLNDSATIFANGADKISSAFIHFGNSIFALAEAITAYTASKNVAE